MKFMIEKYGKTSNFHAGQKVIATYYHESIQYPDKNFCFDEPFTPSKFGVIKGDAGMKDYYLGTDNKEQFLWVKFREYLFKKAIPMSCLLDAGEYIQLTKIILNQGECNNDTRQYFEDNIKQGEKFINPNP